MPYDQFRWFGVTYEEARKGCYNGDARLANLLLTMLQKMEVNSEKFVDSLGPVSELV